MSGTITGFVTDQTFIDNNPFQVSSVFELSPKGFTYAKDRTYHSLPTYPGNDLIVFKSMDSVTSDVIPMNNTILTAVFALVKLVKEYPDSNMVPYDPVDYRNYLEANGPVTVSNINIGGFESYSGKEYPRWFNFTTNDADAIIVTIYIADEAFLSNYEYYDIEIVPFLPSTTAFNATYPNVLVQLDEMLYSTFNDRLETTKNNRPPTYTKVIDFWYYNRLNPTQRTKVYWGVIVYGEAGNDIDVIKDELETFILANPANVRNDWVIMFPDIFARTEFLLVPMWHKVAIENLTTLSNLYSSMMYVKEPIEFIRDNYSNLYTEMQVYNNLITFPYDYKAITIASIAGLTNAADKDALFELYPDYIPVNTSSLDFMRMQPTTREWMYKLEVALLAAETHNVTSPVPPGYRKVTRSDGKKYIGFYIDSVNYLIAYRYNTMFD